MVAYCVPCNGPDSLHRLASDPDSYPRGVDTGIWAINDNSFFFFLKKKLHSTRSCIKNNRAYRKNRVGFGYKVAKTNRKC